MTVAPGKYTARDQDLVEIARRHPFGWIISAADLQATSLPLLATTTAAGRIDVLRGHLARSNPQVQSLARDSRALVLFTGPNEYISPSWLTDRTQAPTWNYAVVRLIVDVEFFEDPDRLREDMRNLIDAMETGRPNRWRFEEIQHRYDSLARHIIGFRAHVRETAGVFKLGQGERPDVYRDMFASLSQLQATELVEWMRRYYHPSQR